MSKYTDTRKRIIHNYFVGNDCSDAVIIEKLADEIDKYREKIKWMTMKADGDAERNRELKLANNALSERVKELKTEIDNLKKPTVLQGEVRNENLHKVIDEIMAIPSKQTDIYIKANSDEVPRMTWTVLGYPYTMDLSDE